VPLRHPVEAVRPHIHFSKIRSLLIAELYYIVCYGKLQYKVYFRPVSSHLRRFFLQFAQKINGAAWFKSSKITCGQAKASLKCDF